MSNELFISQLSIHTYLLVIIFSFACSPLLVITIVPLLDHRGVKIEEMQSYSARISIAEFGSNSLFKNSWLFHETETNCGHGEFLTMGITLNVTF